MKTFVFDLGKVLLAFEPHKFVHELFNDSEKEKILMEKVFKSEAWLDLDRGIIDDDTAYIKMSKDIPYKTEVKYLLDNWHEILTPINENIDVLKIIKEKNFPLYLLSNFHKQAFRKVFNKFSFFSCFDGLLVSSDTGAIKPDPEIFKILFKKFLINPHDCIFIDDMKDNIEAAEVFGMKGILYERGKTQLLNEINLYMP